jgi:DUF1365 family protein
VTTATTPSVDPTAPATPEAQAAEPRPVLDLPTLPALVVGHVEHTRLRPLRHRFRHRHYQWLLDVDAPLDLPRWVRPLATVRAADHFDGAGTIRAGLSRFLAGHGMQVAGADRVLMLAHARVLGYVFDPISVFWVLDPQARVRAVVVEVHNTYAGRHAYLLGPAEAVGRGARVDKEFYVSPFNDLRGHYRIRVTLTPARCRVSVTLHRDGEVVLTASAWGQVRAATTGQVLRTAARVPLMPQRACALIRAHGVWLWLRRLPVVPRPDPSKESIR